MNGVLNVDKPPKVTSQTAVTRVKRALGIRKAGHAGTLDPDATGVLLVCLGRATKLFEALQTHDKEYVATITFGIETDTYDASGEVVARRDVPNLTAEEIDAALEPFRGEIEQVPPMFSALKHHGQPLYKLARKGVVVDRPPRRVRIDVFELLDLRLPEARVRIVCSKGTYVRSLIHDLGQQIGCGAILTALTRTRSGPFRVEAAIPLAEVERDPEAARRCVVPIEDVTRTLAARDGSHVDEGSR